MVKSFAGTNIEYKLSKDKNLIPVILFDKSDGGDMAFSNYDLNQLKRFKNIDVYLEIDSVNSIIFNYLKNNFFKNKNLIIHNMDQSEIEKLKFSKKPVIIITYSPYSEIYKKRGLKEIISSKHKGIYIIDALFVDKNVYLNNKKRFDNLKICIKKAIIEIKTHPKISFKKIKNYFQQEYNFEAFKEDLKLIKWIDKKDLKGYDEMPLKYSDED